MRVLYILERWPELSQTFVAEEIAALQSLGVEVEVGCVARGHGEARRPHGSSFADFGKGKRVTSAMAQLASAPTASMRQVLSEGSWPPPSGRGRLRGLLRLAPLRGLALRADHIHAHFATEAADIARLLSASTSTPWSFTAHGVDSYGDQDALRINLESAAFARAASPHVASQLRGASPDASIVEIPVAVALERFTRSGPYNDLGPVISVGRLVEKKGFDDLINAFGTARLGDRELWIIGDGPLKADLEGRAEGLHVRFLGAQDPDDVAEAMKQASAFALLPKVASDGDRDGRPAALVEAMAAGLPILSTNLPGIDDFVHPDCGVLVDQGSAVQAAVALREILDLPLGAREAMGAAGIARSSLFNPISVAKQLAELFTQDLGTV